MMRAFCALLALSGAIIMIQATVRFHKLYLQNCTEIYTAQHFNRTSSLISLILMYFFVIGFFVGFTHIVLVDIDLIFAFVVVVFFLGGLYIYASVDSRIKMSALFRDKSMEVMRTFVNAIDMKDAYTKGHSQQVYNITRVIYDHLDDALKAEISKPKLLDAAILHDIGKISIHDTVLKKPGALSAAEWDVIKMHPADGKRMLDDTVFRDISDWVLYHHERMDGNGYYNLKREHIPIESRIIAIADTYGALCTDRVYRTRKGHDVALQIMMQSAGTQLDEELMAVFSAIPQACLEQELRLT